MKIGILTQPLHNNYGGLLQAYALQTVLKRMGHEAWIIDRDYPDTPLWRKSAIVIKNTLRRMIFKSNYVFPFWITGKQKEKIAENTSAFVANNIYPKTEKIKSNKALRKKIKKWQFECYIVGSDQVWRPLYSPCITNYFLDFVKDKKNTGRIAYAASFGVDYWAFTEKQTKKCAELIKEFDAISVREDTGISLSENYLKTKAIQTLDPTLLLNKSDYEELIPDTESMNTGNLMVYILDSTPDKTEIVNMVAKNNNLQAFSIMPDHTLSMATKNEIKKCIFPSVTKWIRGFIDAEFVITDSFHGCIFSIIFNKPFIAIGNNERGMTRFTSLLKIFNLEDRLIFTSDELTYDKLTSTVDWDKINKIRSEKKDESIQFLLNNIR
ncbi:MAG: polysaccharide pyruvyl transferase family protein [Bacteroidales bacterium]|jgi:hypothetical protein|nr:polysaccharide pyruvyl transferase family protein [Bacteroidales bacterium]